jgi:myo-inositol-1(or 4)-monophosphatase
MNYIQSEENLKLCKSLTELVSSLRKFITNQDFSQLRFRFKHDGSPVSELDLAVEDFVRQLILELLPGFQFISEEAPLPTEWNGNYIVLDPIDGTENFISGIPIWGVGLAVFLKNELYASWVVFPEMQLEKSSKLLTLFQNTNDDSFRGPLEESRVFAYSSNSIWNEIAPKFEDEIRVFGCSLFNLTLASAGSLQSYFAGKGAKLWDIAPCLLFILESGRLPLVNGKEYRGEFLDPNYRYVVEIKNH